jgi:hypothetical protein
MRQTAEAKLADWRFVTARLEQLQASGRLDEAELEMIGVLRFSSNLLLREQVLLHARHVAHPSDQLLAELLEVVGNRRLFVDERTLAVQALGHLAPRRYSHAGTKSLILRTIRRLEEALEPPEAQVFRQAVSRVINRLTGPVVR